ncbi:kinase-like protein [Ceratobasidium sp. AG-I]|nr:kinase-like protein [Ceratobasidium sp. AG-I]
MQFGIAVGPQFHSTFAMIQKVRMDDERWLDGFIGRIDQAAPGPGSFGRAYQSQDTDSMDQMTDGVLQSQASVLAQDTELREEAEKQARELTKWIMGVTSQKLKPGLILGRRLVGEPKRIFITERNVIYTAEFVSGETVVLKMPNDQMQGQDSTTILKRFHAEVNLWHSLRYDHILPFYGIGMRQEADRNQVYGISPYLPNGDVRTYRQQHPLSVEESLQIAHDVALALRYLHERDAPIVHFNVRSRNVLINNEGRGVLGGFGLSQELLIPGSQTITDAASLPTDVTRFRAPEYQSDPGFPIKISADVWGWAMTTLELVGGEPPFCEIPNDFQAVTAMVGRVRPNRDAYPGIQQLYEPDALWHLLEDCWAHEESKRPVMGEVVLRMKGIRDRQNELGRQAPPVVSAPPRRRSQGASIEPSDGRANQATEQGRAPGR